MKWIGLCLLMGWSWAKLKAQVIYEPVFIDQCTGEQDARVLWNIKKKNASKFLAPLPDRVDTTSFFFEMECLQGDMQQIELDTGQYSLYYMDFNSRQFMEKVSVKLRTRDSIRDTIFTEKMQYVVYISNPPFSEYMDCDERAEGVVIDYYQTQQIRQIGTFKEGQLVDTLWEFYRNGAVEQLTVAQHGEVQQWNYHENGQLASIYDSKKSYQRTYYNNGQLKSRETWGRKKYASVYYYKNGQLKEKRTDRRTRCWNEQGVLIEQLTRKQLFLWTYWWSKWIGKRENPYFDHYWKQYDTTGQLTREVVFTCYDNTIPSHIEEIEPYLLERIDYYHKGTITKKIVVEYQIEEEELVHKAQFYQLEGKDWKVVHQLLADDEAFYEVVEQFQP